MIPYFEQQLKELELSLNSLDEGEFRRWIKEAVAAEDNGHKIIVSGLGKNVPICEKFVGSMVSLGMNACFLHTNSAVHGDMGIVKDGDMVILLSKSGETSESVYLAKLLLKKKIRIWLLSFAKESQLAKMIPNHIILELGHEGDPWNIMPNNSTTLNLMILQGLVMHMAEAKQMSLGDFRRNHPGGHIGQVLNGRISEVEKTVNT